jgi:hypothetical protein
LARSLYMRTFVLRSTMLPAAADILGLVQTSDRAPTQTRSKLVYPFCRARGRGALRELYVWGRPRTHTNL